MINLSALKANIDHEIEASKEESNSTFRCTMGLAELISEALEQTLYVDTVEVIRCKDCEWWTKQKNSAQGRCGLMGIYPTGAWYCGNGRRTNND